MSQLVTAFLGDQLVDIQVTTQIVGSEYTNFAFYFIKSDLKQLRYDQNRHIIASHGNSGRLADGQFGESKLLYKISASQLVQKWLKYTCLGGWADGVGRTVSIVKVSVQMGLNWNYQLELSLEKCRGYICSLHKDREFKGPLENQSLSWALLLDMFYVVEVIQPIFCDGQIVPPTSSRCSHNCLA